MKKAGLYFLLLFCALGCKLTKPLERVEVRPEIRQAQQQRAIEIDTTETKYITFVDHNGVKQTIVEAETVNVDGEDLMNINLEGVTVVAKNKTVPERLGKVSIEFLVGIPKPLQDKRWVVVITPVADRITGKDTLESIVCTGDIYKQYQGIGQKELDIISERNKRFNRDNQHVSNYLKKRYNLFEFENSRIDTITRSDSTIFYHYSQELETDEARSIKVMLQGRVFAMDRSEMQLPLSDTLNFNISSMVQFIDTTTRYKLKVIERQVEENFSAKIDFVKGRARVDTINPNNKLEIAKVNDIIKKLTYSGELVLDSITMTATSSPDGAYQFNAELAEKRAHALKSFFAKVNDDPEAIDTLFKVHWIPEDWDRLTKLIKKDTRLANKGEIEQIISEISNPDLRERTIRKKFPIDYAYLKESVYPELRTVEFNFNLHRRGMVKDTMHTTEVDSTYLMARELLNQRKYIEALPILAEYEDFNYAICLMSLGYDSRAIQILERTPRTSNREYLLAILSSRVNNDSEAVKYYLSSCELDDTKAFRGALDPELNKLIQKYKLNDRFN